MKYVIGIIVLTLIIVISYELGVESAARANLKQIGE